MKNIIIQSAAFLIIYALVLGIGYSIIDTIGWWYFTYLFVVGFLIFTITTSRYSWIITILQFLIVGFLSFLLMVYLVKIYGPYIEQYCYQNGNTIKATIGLIELFFIKQLSDLGLHKIELEKKESIIDKLLR